MLALERKRLYNKHMDTQITPQAARNAIEVLHDHMGQPWTETEQAVQLLKDYITQQQLVLDVLLQR